MNLYMVKYKQWNSYFSENYERERLSVGNNKYEAIAKVKETLEAFRPQLNADGGDMEFINIDDENKVHLKLTGACGSCPMATMTLKMGIERYLKETCPEISEVVQD